MRWKGDEGSGGDGRVRREERGRVRREERGRVRREEREG